MSDGLQAKSGRVLSEVAAAFLGVTTERVRQLGEAGVIRSKKIGKRRYYLASDVARLKREREALAAGLVGKEQLAAMC
jgi:DNA-binding transcriptional MerR regulator